MQPELYEAAMSGDFDSLMNLTDVHHSDILNQKTPMDNNVLHIAARHKQASFIEQLIHQHPSGGSLLWHEDYKGHTPLHTAARVGCVDIIRIIIDYFRSSPPSDIEGGRLVDILRKANADEETALHQAVRNRHFSAVKLLVEADPTLCDISNCDDESPLYLAAAQGFFDIAELILDADASPSPSPSSSSSSKGPRGMTVLHATIYYTPQGLLACVFLDSEFSFMLDELVFKIHKIWWIIDSQKQKIETLFDTLHIDHVVDKNWIRK